MSVKVFISHAHKDGEAAKILEKRLNDRGINTWFDQNEFKPGEQWEQKIRNALIESDTVLLVIGDGDLSPNVLVEAGMALSQGKQVFPVLVSETANANVFADLRNLNQVNAVGPNGIDNAADQIAQALVGTDAVF